MTHPGGLRIIYAGTPEFAVPPLQRLIENRLSPVAVFTQPDRPAGRGRRLQASPVKQAALKDGLRVLQPESLRTPESHELLAELRPDLMIVVAYGLILPGPVLQIPSNGCWNIHASLLPRWRGAAPIQRTIEAGDRESGVCVMQMDEGLDTGPVIQRVRIPLDGSETGGSLHDTLAQEGAAALLDCVQRLAQGKAIVAEPQAREGVCYAHKLEKSEARIQWSDPCDVLERRVRAFNPWPVAWCMIGDVRTRIWRADCVDAEPDRAPGSVLSAGPEGIDIATGSGALRLLELQRPGKRRMSASDYLNARRLPGTLEESSGNGDHE